MDEMKYKLLKALTNNEYLYPDQIRELLKENKKSDDEISIFLGELYKEKILNFNVKYRLLIKSNKPKDYELYKNLQNNHICFIRDVSITSKGKDILFGYENQKSQQQFETKKDKAAITISIIGLTFSFFALVISLLALIIQFKELP